MGAVLLGVVTAVNAAEQLPYFPAPTPYLEPQFLGPADAFSNVVLQAAKSQGSYNNNAAHIITW